MYELALHLKGLVRQFKAQVQGTCKWEVMLLTEYDISGAFKAIEDELIAFHDSKTWIAIGPKRQKKVSSIHVAGRAAKFGEV